MKIDKKELRTLWYEDRHGNVYDEPTKGAEYMYVRHPLEVTTTCYTPVDQDIVNKCKHPKRYIARTFGWIDGIKGRECKLCGGTQVRKTYQLWGSKWKASGSRKLFSGTTSLGTGDIVLAMANSGDYTLEEAILTKSIACERCGNALAYKYTDGKEGYAEDSENYIKSGTRCKFCEPEEDKDENNL